jgi:hypothetical protein
MENFCRGRVVKWNLAGCIHGEVIIVVLPKNIHKNPI